MALPDYFRRSAVAAAQVLSGFDEEAIRDRLERVTVAIEFGNEAAASSEGRHCIDMAVRLLSRLYPRLAIRGPDPEPWVNLARAINPRIELRGGMGDLALGIGPGGGQGSKSTVFVGCDGWDASVSGNAPQPVGQSSNPLGSGAAACLGAAWIFRSVFVDDQTAGPDEELTLSTLEFERRPSGEQPGLAEVEIPASTVLVGLGAIGNGALWALARAPVGGELHLVDPERIELSNMQRYVLSALADEGKAKIALAQAALNGKLRGWPHEVDWNNFIVGEGHRWERVLVALDSAADRRAVQDGLPRWIVNGWTQAGDLGVSVHPWKDGACLACLYLAQGQVPSEDEQVAAALGVPQHQQQVRRLLVGSEPTPPELLEEAASALEIEPEVLLAYKGRPLREIYVEGLCGGGVVPLDRIGEPARDVHVPLAHQSALAGILLAARLLADLLGRDVSTAEATRLDVMRPIAEHITQPIAKDARGICICQDPVYQTAFEAKWGL